MILLDTGVLIAYFREVDKSKTWFYQLSGVEDLAISVITEYEFKVGFKNQQDLFLSQIISAVNVLPYDSSCADKSVSIYQNLKKRSLLIPIQDIFIAATALQNDIPIATLNTNHFQRIEGLQLITQ